MDYKRERYSCFGHHIGDRLRYKDNVGDEQMKHSKLTWFGMFISVLSYAGVFIGDMFNIETNKLIMFSITSVLFMILSCSEVIIDYIKYFDASEEN